ncbi:hypothetical protein Pyn_27193 [Prunus yedoensis var. nudiflora]|uniref:Uncharacterized protein n=1 Tax=Prunus yedoensis var. nudiflora TaxID=2094558 RepID=A0A314Z2T2_PRUYE|nr:hypothetical protein Pyn_27193 [Prunus yedoensis var. nudiflora]
MREAADARGNVRGRRRWRQRHAEGRNRGISPMGVRVGQRGREFEVSEGAAEVGLEREGENLRSVRERERGFLKLGGVDGWGARGGVWVGEKGSEFQVSEGERARVCDGWMGWSWGWALPEVVVWTFESARLEEG